MPCVDDAHAGSAEIASVRDLPNPRRPLRLRPAGACAHLVIHPGAPERIDGTRRARTDDPRRLRGAPIPRRRGPILDEPHDVGSEGRCGRYDAGGVGRDMPRLVRKREGVRHAEPRELVGDACMHASVYAPTCLCMHTCACVLACIPISVRTRIHACKYGRIPRQNRSPIFIGQASISGRGRTRGESTQIRWSSIRSSELTTRFYLACATAHNSIEA